MTIRKIALDTETTGIGYRVNRLIEIAAVEFDPQSGMPTGNNYHVYLNPEMEIPPEVSAVHGKTWADLKDEPLFADVAPSFLEFIEGAELVIHNAPFDLGFLNNELKKAKRAKVEDLAAKIEDTCALSRRYVRARKHTLDALCERYGVDKSIRTLHGALVDCELLARVYPALMQQVTTMQDRVHALLPFQMGEILDDTDLDLKELAYRHIVLGEMAKLFSSEQDRYTEALKKMTQGIPVEDEFFTIEFKNRTQTDWERLVKEHLGDDFSMAPYQKQGSAMYVKAV